MSDTAVTTTATTVPEPRTATEPARPPRRERPATDYWDVTECCWRAVSAAAVSPGAPGDG